MAKRIITRGTAAGADLIFHVFAQDSAATDGAGKASVAYGSWACRYVRNGEALSGAIAPEDITTLGTYAAPTANTNIRIKAVDNTNAIGLYEVQIHADWVNATNTCKSLVVYLTATGVAVLPIEIELIGINLQDTVRGGMTALPNAAADAAGGLPISDAGGLDLDAKLANTNEVTAARMAELDPANLPTDVAAVKSDTAAILDDTGTSGVVLPQAQADKVWLTTTRALTDKVGFALSAAGIQAIWDALTSALTVVGSIGKRLVDYVDAAISSRSTYAGADTAGTTALLARATEARLAELDAANLPTDVAALPTLAEIEASTVLATEASVAAMPGNLSNQVEDDIVRDANGLKTSSNIYVYNSAANAGVHDKVTGLTAKHAVTVTYTAQRMTVFKSVRTV